MAVLLASGVAARAHMAAASPVATVTSGYLHTNGVRLEDAGGRQVRLTGLNWFGLETCAFAPHGLWARNWCSLMVLWYTDRYSEVRWIADWVRLAQRYAGNDAIIGADLHNEPHGPATWGDGNRATDWRLATERAGNATLRVNPHWLIFVEGEEHLGTDWYWWGGNLAAARRYPVRLAVPQRLVYEVHDYGPEVSSQGWFNVPSFPKNLPGLWGEHWGYLQEQGIAPVLVGEFGGKAVESGQEETWIHTLMAYIQGHGLSYTFWLAGQPHQPQASDLIGEVVQRERIPERDRAAQGIAEWPRDAAVQRLPWRGKRPPPRLLRPAEPQRVAENVEYDIFT